MNDKIKICTQFFFFPPNVELKAGAPYTVYFNDDIFEVVKFEDFRPDGKNYLVLDCQPTETIDFLTRKNKKFYEDCIKNNIDFVFCHEGWNLFMVEEDIFKSNVNKNQLLYWQIINCLEKNGITEDKVYFIHCAGGYLEEVQMIKKNIVQWTGAPIDIKSKHLELPLYLPWAQNRQAKTAINLQYHFACLFAGRPAQHRHDLVKDLWYKGLLNKGKISLTKIQDQSDFGKLPDIAFDKVINLHTLPGYQSREDNVFEDIFLWVAGETACPNQYPNFSEKLVRGILHQRPFALLGNTGSLAYLRKFGFKTFNDFWDESYDLDSTFKDRILKVSKIIEDICVKDLHTLRSMLDDMRPILEHNKKLLVETNWTGRVVNFLS